MGTYATFTIATSLLVAIVLIPVLRMVFAAPADARAQSPAMQPSSSCAGGLGVLFAVAALVPMGGDGVLLHFVDSRLALALVLSLGLLLLGTTSRYARLASRQRLWLQLGFAATASLVGLIPSGVQPSELAHGVAIVVLVACMNALRVLDSTDNLAIVVAACTAGTLAIFAHFTGSPAWGDLNLGLCGALIALLGFNLTGGRLRTNLGAGGTLAIGFLLGSSMLRLSEQAIPGTRVWLVLPFVLPLANLVLVLFLRHVRGATLDIDRADCNDHLHQVLLRQGLTPTQLTILYATTVAVSGIVSLQLLEVL